MPRSEPQEGRFERAPRPSDRSLPTPARHSESRKLFLQRNPVVAAGRQPFGGAHPNCVEPSGGKRQ